MKKIILLLIIPFAFNSFVNGQCTEVPVKEAVRNGDFEAGYLQGPAGANHTFSAGGAYDFYSDMDFLGEPNYDPCTACSYAIGDKYAVMRADTFSCGNCSWPTDYEHNTMWGVGYGGDGLNFRDHTFNQEGKGHALIVDLFTKTVSSKTGGKPIAWEQTMDIYPSESYFFSAWIANYANGTAPVMQVTIIPRSGGVDDVVNTVTLPASGTPTGVMNWTQISTTWIPPGIYDEVTIRFEFVNTEGASTGIDVAIDDISFINSCQNISSQNNYVANFNLPDTINLCELGGEQLLDPQVPVSERGNASISWYEGSGNPQTETDNGIWTKNVNTPGTYRVCIDDPDNGCPVSDVVTVVEEYSIEISDIELCDPVSVDLDAGINIPNGAMSSIFWSGPSGDSNSRNYTVNSAGAHSVTIIASSQNPGCAASDNFNVTSNIPTPPSLNYCAGDVTKDLEVGDGKSYIWSTSPTMSPSIGEGVTVVWNIPGGTVGDQTLYIQSAETSPLGSAGPTGAWSGWAGDNESVTITVNSAVKLVSFDVRADSWVNGGCPGSSNPINFNLSGGNSVTESVSCGSVSTVNAGWTLSPGTYTLSASGNWYNKPAGGVSELGSGAVTLTYPSGNSSFINLVFEESQACAPVPVIVEEVSCCTSPTDDPLIDVPTSTLEVCSPNTGEVISVSGLTDGLDFKWQESSDGTTFTDISGETGVVSGGQLTLSNLSTDEQWYRYVLAETGNLDKTCVKTSDSVQMVINPLPVIDSIGKSPFSGIYCKDEVYEVEAHVDETTGYPVTYQWSIDASGTDSVFTGITTPGTHTYKVLVDAQGCLDSMEIQVDVSNLDTVIITNPPSLCSSDNPYQLTLDPNKTTSGVWTDSIGGNTYVTSGGMFDPQYTGLNDGKIKVIFTSDGLCPGADTAYVTITSRIDFDLPDGDQSFCLNNNPDTISITVNTGGGKFWTTSGEGISADSMYVVFSEYSAGQVDSLYYGKAGQCGDTAGIELTLLNVDTAE
ncbi:MAG: hypothetical protein CMP67_01970, partial [Flavobacteriales bacterium]|nr:hypothetical protein [Flavobacteriales bacterium]